MNIKEAQEFMKKRKYLKHLAYYLKNAQAFAKEEDPNSKKPN